MMTLRNDRFGWAGFDPGDGSGPRLEVANDADIDAVISSLTEQHSHDQQSVQFAGLDPQTKANARRQASMTKELLRQAQGLKKQLQLTAKNQAQGKVWADPSSMRFDTPTDAMIGWNMGGGMPSFDLEAITTGRIPASMRPHVEHAASVGSQGGITADRGRLESILRQLLEK